MNGFKILRHQLNLENFDHQEQRFPEFSKRYKAELDLKKTEIEKLKAVAEKRPITLLYSAKNEEFNQAIVLRDYLNKI